MTERREEERKGRPPDGRLERWLVRKLQAGSFRNLPRYRPMGGLDGECPERYAANLLDGLRAAGDCPTDLERIKDDGRAFRSWTEAVLPARSAAASL